MPVPADYVELSSNLDPRRIEALWSFDASSAGQHLVLPDGRMDFFVRFRSDELSRIVETELGIAGPSARAALVQVAEGDRFLGLRFRAGWGGVCLRVEPATLRDQALNGPETTHLLGTDAGFLCGARDAAALRSSLIQFGHRRAADLVGGTAPDMAKAIDLLHLSGGRLGLAELARAAGTPERTLRRRIAEAVGLPVKVLASVLRFQRTMRLLAASPNSLTLAQAAIEGGYSDQAHMTREFRRHGGFTPARRPEAAFGSLPLPGLAGMFKIDSQNRE